MEASLSGYHILCDNFYRIPFLLLKLIPFPANENFLLWLDILQYNHFTRNHKLQLFVYVNI